MTKHEDILGRPPVMTFIEQDEPDLTPEDDWRGERFMKVPRNPHAYSGRNMRSAPPKNRKADQMARRDKLAVLAGKGATVTEMELATGVSRTTIFYDLKALGLGNE
tara:strand:- start:9964 stop:10281 length:318 start_codon:yes stop_codon:yes gene_type:complete